MAQIIKMPRLSDTMTEGVVAKWFTSVGDKIKEGDILAEIETDKATMEFESFNEGTLLYIGLKEGETAPVDSLLAIIGEEGEDFSALLNSEKDITAKSTSNNKNDVVSDKPKFETSMIPDNITVIRMPRLSDTMTEGTIVTWFKKTGDKVKEGDILAEIETDKATMEFESFNEGTLLYIGLKEGETAPVDSLLAIIGEEGIDVSSVVVNFSNAKEPKIEDKTTITSKIIKSNSQDDSKKMSEINSDKKRIMASPLAKVLAKEKDINLEKVKGTGEGGRIIKKDIENYIPLTRQKKYFSKDPNETPEEFFKSYGIGKTEVKNSQMRKAIVSALDNSQTTSVTFTIGMDIDMDNAITSRKEINSLPDTKVSFNDLVVKACAMALKFHPKINTEWTDDKIIYNHHISIGVAVAIEDGLVVPVIPFADKKSLTQIGTEVKDLVIKAKTKKLTPAEMSGSTFTISNLGMFGVDNFTSIINQPNSAILSVGGIKQKPVVKDGKIVVGNVMNLTLACDHRTIDGSVGAEFMNSIKQYLENPVTMLA